MQLQHFLRRRNKVRFVVYQQDVCHEYPAKNTILRRGPARPAALVITSLNAFYPYGSAPRQARPFRLFSKGALHPEAPRKIGPVRRTNMCPECSITPRRGQRYVVYTANQIVALDTSPLSWRQRGRAAR